MKFDGFNLQTIYLNTERESFDLHNCFDFIGFEYDISSRTLSLHWKPSSCAPACEHRCIMIVFHQVTHFSACPRDPAIPFTEDDCLENVCFPQIDSECLFSFMSGFSFRVNAELAQCIIQ